MDIIFIFGPCWKNLKILKSTINNNLKFFPDSKIYIATNDKNVFNYFYDTNIICEQFSNDNQGHQTACYNSIIYGMHMIIKYEKIFNDNDIVIFSHEDVYIKDLTLLNNAINKFKKGFDIVCRKYEGTKNGEKFDYYMNDAFLIKKNRIKEIFGKSKMKTIYSGMFCEYEFTQIIQSFKIFYIPYHSHSTHKDSELGFYHILNKNIRNIPFWDKSNINDIINN